MFIEVKNDNFLLLFTSPIIDFLCKQFSKNGFDMINVIKMLKKIDGTITDMKSIYDTYHLNEDEIAYLQQ